MVDAYDYEYMTTIGRLRMMTKDAVSMVRWRVNSYQSGSVVVTCQEPTLPHLYLYAPTGVRHETAVDIAEFLNGGVRPKWLDDCERIQDCIIGTDGTKVIATGPFYDCNPPALDWSLCEDAQSKQNRKELIDKLGVPVSDE